MNRAIGDCETGRLRENLLAQASGDILEIGFGTGLNLKYYPPAIRALVAVDPIRLKIPVFPSGPEVRFEVMQAEALRFCDASFDTVVSTFTLCSVADLPRTLSEVRRVLRPGGKFLFLEHGKSWSKTAACVQNLADPFFVFLACGCHVKRDIPGELENSGLQVESVRRIRFKKYPISGFYYQGVAVKQI